MIFRILKNDLKRKKTMNIILFLFIVLATMFVASGINNVITVMNGTDYYLDKAGVGDFIILTMGDGAVGSLDEMLEKEIVPFPSEPEDVGFFISMSDFVNRRLEAGKNGLKGALQAAIDATDINADFDTPSDTKITEVPQGSMYQNAEAAKGSIHTAAPGYLIQSDVLASLGNILTIRDDTFTVRAYGCVRNPNKAVLAQAWCEAVVQRTMQYVDPTNSPEDSDYTPDGKKSKKALTNTNKVLGRQFRIVSFKWLGSWDI